jgi:hypothetical protein
MKKKQRRGKKMLDKYGVAGLGIFGTILLGPPITMVIGVFLSRSKRKVLFWAMLGIVFWSSVLTAAAAYSLELFTRLTVFK